eukprot:5950651-Pyramimonas_sp.AAC.1
MGPLLVHSLFHRGPHIPTRSLFPERGRARRRVNVQGANERAHNWPNTWQHNVSALKSDG